MADVPAARINDVRWFILRRRPLRQPCRAPSADVLRPGIGRARVRAQLPACCDHASIARSCWPSSRLGGSLAATSRVDSHGRRAPWLFNPIYTCLHSPYQQTVDGSDAPFAKRTSRQTPSTLESVARRADRLERGRLCAAAPLPRWFPRKSMVNVSFVSISRIRRGLVAW